MNASYGCCACIQLMGSLYFCCSSRGFCLCLGGVSWLFLPSGLVVIRGLCVWNAQGQGLSQQLCTALKSCHDLTLVIPVYFLFLSTAAIWNPFRYCSKWSFTNVCLSDSFLSILMGRRDARPLTEGGLQSASIHCDLWWLRAACYKACFVQFFFLIAILKTKIPVHVNYCYVMYSLCGLSSVNLCMHLSVFWSLRVDLSGQCGVFPCITSYKFSLFSQLLCVDPTQRISSLGQLKSHPYMSDLEFDKVLKQEVKPLFVPSVSYSFFFYACDSHFVLQYCHLENPLDESPWD